MNILILSCGTRNKIVQYFKRALCKDGLVIATDCSELAPALYEADKHYIVPRITEPLYIDKIIDICKKENITGVLSLIDPELSLLAKNADRFKEVGTTVVGSDYDICEKSLNKYDMYKWLVKHNYNSARSFVDKEEFYKAVESKEIKYPVFVKPVSGSASIAIFRAEDKETVDLLCAHSEKMLIQEYMTGQEIGADVYIDMISGQVVSIFAKKKIVMRAGETDKAVSFKNKELFDFIERFSKEFGYKGQIDIDIFEAEGKYYISEVNPRFGGGYPHAYECGVDHMKLILNNLQGKANTRNIGDYKDGVYMMKYCDVMIK